MLPREGSRHFQHKTAHSSNSWVYVFSYFSIAWLKWKIKNTSPRRGSHLLLKLTHEAVKWHTNQLYSQKDITTHQGLSSSLLLKASCHHKSFVVWNGKQQVSQETCFPKQHSTLFSLDYNSWNSLLPERVKSVFLTSQQDLLSLCIIAQGIFLPLTLAIIYWFNSVNFFFFFFEIFKFQVSVSNYFNSFTENIRESNHHL